MSDIWKAYCPEDGESADDARVIKPRVERRILDAEDAAEIACADDFDRNDGWERGETAFLLCIIDPKGITWRFSARHEPAVNHTVSALP